MAMRTITVKGIGKVSARPDYVEIYLELESQDLKYDKAMKKASKKIQQLNDSLGTIGFEKDAVKTTNFNVQTKYENVKKRDGNYQREFRGYSVDHSLKISFDFDSEKLSQVLTVLSGCIAEPSLQIRFTVKDATAVNEELLRNATINARRKAEVMCEASGVQLGILLSIDYNWGELNVYSQTRYSVADDDFDYLAPACVHEDIDFTPDDIDVSDTVTFVWEIEEGNK